MASQRLKMMSQALDNRLPPLKSGQEYAPWNTFWDEDLEGDDKGELGAVIHHQVWRAVTYTQTDQKDIAIAQCTPLTDTMGLDIAESTIFCRLIAINLSFHHKAIYVKIIHWNHPYGLKKFQNSVSLGQPEIQWGLNQADSLKNFIAALNLTILYNHWTLPNPLNLSNDALAALTNTVLGVIGQRNDLLARGGESDQKKLSSWWSEQVRPNRKNWG